MNTRFLIAFLGAVSLTSLTVQAQPGPPLVPAPVTFQSAFDGYQPYSDDKTGNWKAANDTTAQIGGWRAYAKEASAPAVQPAPQTAAQPARPIAPDTLKAKP